MSLSLRVLLALLLGLMAGAVFGVLGHQRYLQWRASVAMPACPACDPGLADPGLPVQPPLGPGPAPDSRPPDPHPGATVPPGDSTWVGTDIGPLAIPVQGITRGQLADTFTDARSQGRSHDAIDIMAPAGTPVLAVADGTVEKLFYSERGGVTLYQFEPSGRYVYYYAHLQDYAPGIVEGARLRRGQVIGTVGSTGNASPEAPHLHFAVMRLGPERNWWQGEAINPYPLLLGSPARH